MAEGFRIAAAYVSVSPDTSGFKEELKAQVEEATAGVEGKVRITADTAELDAKVDEARAKVDELDGTLAEPSVRLNNGDLDAKADEAKAKLDELDAKSARPEVGLSSADLDAKVDDAKAKLDELDARGADPRLGLDDAEFNAKLDAARAKLAEMDGTSASPRLGGSGGGGGGGESEGFGGGEGGLGGALAMGLGALMPGIGGAAAGLGALGAVGAMAFGPVAKALSAAHQASLNVGLTPQELAATRFSNQVQQQQAGNTVMMAREQAGQDAVTASASIEQAQMNLASVTRNAAAQQVQALQSVKQAEQGVEEANYGLTEAQYNLTQAWEQAREQIKQLDDQLADSKLNVQQAQLAIQQALHNQRLVDQNAYSTALDRQQATLAVAQAQQQLKDAQDQESAAAYQANLVNKQGVAGTQLVIQAKQGVVQATYQQTDANKQLSIAQRQATLTAQNSATQMAEAQLQVKQAQEQAAYQQKIDAQQVAIAERNVTNTIAEQQLQMAATKSTSNEAANQFLKDMSRMSPAGRAMVEQILGMKGAFKEFEAAAQDAVFPGFTVFLQGLQLLLPDVSGDVTRMGGAFSDAFSSLGDTVGSPQFASMLNGLINNGLQFANVVVPAFTQFAGELGIIGSQQGAVSGLANLLAGVGHGLTGMADVIGEDTGAINDFLTAAGNVIAQIGPGLGQIVDLIADTLKPLTTYLDAHPNGTITILLGQIVASMLLFKPLVKLVGAPFRALTLAVDSIKGLPATLKGIVDKIVATWGRLTGLGTASTTAAGTVGATGAAETTAAEAEAAGTVRTAGRDVPVTSLPSGLLVPSSAMPVGETAAVGDTAAVGGGAAAGLGMMGPLGLATAAAALGIGIAYYADQVQKASDRAKGIVETAGDKFEAASEIGTQHVSASFQQVADHIANAVQSSSKTVAKSGEYAASRWGDYTQDWSKHNNALVDVMQLGKTKLGQTVAQFIDSYHGNVLAIAREVKQSGTTIDNQLQSSLQQIFTSWGQAMPGYWQGLANEQKKDSDAAFAKMAAASKSDYDGLRQAFKQYEDDLTHGREDKARTDASALQTAMNKFMTDQNSGNILTADTQISKLGADINQYLKDSVGGNASAAQADIQKMGKDVAGQWSKTSATMAKAATSSFVDGMADYEKVFAAAEKTVGGKYKTYAEQGAGNALKNAGYADGGRISGPGGPRSDSILARVSDGEFVVNAKSTSAFLPLLDAINRAPRFADGGLATYMGATIDTDAGAQILAYTSGMKLINSQLGAALQSAGGSSAKGFPGSAVGPAQKYAQSQLAKFGWGADQMGPLIKLWNQESGWNPNAVNPSSGAYGIPQALGHGHPYNLGDYVAQINWGLKYIQQRYGSPAAAWSHEVSHNWYDQGGWLPPGTMPMNGLKKPEAVLTPDQSEALVTLAEDARARRSTGAPSGPPVTIQFVGTQYPTTEQMAAIKREMALALGGAA